ncbi:exodeoxyribonuclease III [Neorhizobium sp. P12A]|uniref:exodeoxyribonuclease III n=1 Tax=Neorhizobium sp. P12A TaxID=2268027 RepID=UPI001FEDF907|nr:exodeoxyribonuclease III [Neorhizobium sp. P12A]
MMITRRFFATSVLAGSAAVIAASATSGLAKSNTPETKAALLGKAAHQVHYKTVDIDGVSAIERASDRFLAHLLYRFFRRFPRLALEDRVHVLPNETESTNSVVVAEPRETRRGLPGDPDDSHSRYIEAAIGGMVIGCLYLPNGNPAPGPKFDYKLRRFERLRSYSAELFELEFPVAPVADFNGMPTDLDVYAPDRWRDDALFRPEVRAAYAELIAMGWTDAIRLLHPEEHVYTFWKYFRNAFARDAGLRIDHFLLSPSLRERLEAGGVDKFARAWEHASDHAPVWIELDDG